MVDAIASSRLKAISPVSWFIRNNSLVARPFLIMFIIALSLNVVSAVPTKGVVPEWFRLWDSSTHKRVSERVISDSVFKVHGSFDH